MDYVEFGRTGLRVSVVGLGTGGPSRLGLARGGSVGEAKRLVNLAIENGVNVIDTAQSYGTEAIVGEAMKGVRNEVILSTKVSLALNPGPFNGIRVARRLSARISGLAGLVAPINVLQSRVDESLKRLGTDYIDVLHLHAVWPRQLAKTMDMLGETLLSLKSDGKVRALGITEDLQHDPGHKVLSAALDHDLFDVVMVGFGPAHISAKEQILPKAEKQNIGIMTMAAGRHHREFKDAGHSVKEQEIGEAYCFSRNTPGVHVTLIGTGNADHLGSNIRAVLAR